MLPGRYMPVPAGSPRAFALGHLDLDAGPREHRTRGSELPPGARSRQGESCGDTGVRRVAHAALCWRQAVLQRADHGQLFCAGRTQARGRRPRRQYPSL